MLTATIAVTGNAANFNIVVEAKANDTDDYTPVSVVNLETFAMSPNITANGKYSLPLEGYVSKIKIISYRCRCSNGERYGD